MCLLDCLRQLNCAQTKANAHFVCMLHFSSMRNRLKAVLNWAEHSVHEQLCLLEMFKFAVWFLIDVFELGEQLCSRHMGRRSDVRNVGSAGYGSKLLIG